MLTTAFKVEQLLICIHGKDASIARVARAADVSLRRDRMEAYCLKCRTQREMSNAEATTMKNGKPATKGKCPVCGTTMFKIGKAK